MTEQPTLDDIEEERKIRSYLGKPMKCVLCCVVEEPLKMGTDHLEPIQTYVVRVRNKYRKLLKCKFLSVIVVG